LDVKAFNTIGEREARALIEVLKEPLSGYLAGKARGGDAVQLLEEEWAKTFGVKHAIACNSATSGLMAAAFAVGLGPGHKFICPAMTMSATAAAPMFTGAEPIFGDVDRLTFTLQVPLARIKIGANVRAIFVTNLFGNPARLRELRKMADELDIWLIEDNAQAPFATEQGEFAGTVGHIGVFSLNIHKPIQCGEGGVIVTDSDILASEMRAFINHREHVSPRIGLNLRMPELCAAVALVQLRRGEEIVEGRIKQANAILSAIGAIYGLVRPMAENFPAGRSVLYTIPFTTVGDRHAFVNALALEKIPVVSGYERPLYRFHAFSRFGKEGDCPVAERLHDRKLFYIENCAWDFDEEDIERIGQAFRKAAGML
jgi:perosamine synthetase